MPRYFLSTLVYFWAPVIILGFFLHRKLSPLEWRSFWIAVCILTPLTTVMEYVYLWCDIWTFSEELDPLLGIRIFGAPIEEFSFWYGATPFILLVYLSIDWWQTKKGKICPHG